MVSRGFRCAVLGSPISHSRSPQLHRAAYQALGLTGWQYEAIEMDQAGLAQFIGSLTPDWRGLSLTMPLKQSVIPLLDEVSDTAATVGAVNTVVLDWTAGRSRPVLRGCNTDVSGIELALRTALPDPPPRMRGLILGAGATAGSGVAALARLGVRTLSVTARRPAQAEAELAPLGEALGLQIAFCPWDQAATLLAAADVVISSVPAGAADPVAQELASIPERSTGTLLDVVYHPWPTALAQAGMVRGGTVVSGLEMLLHQAASQVEEMTGCSPAPLEAMRQALIG